MFDLAAGTIERPFRDKHAGASLFAVTSHVVVLGAIALSGLFLGVADKLPEVPTMLAFVAEAPSPPPPPPPPPSPPMVRSQQREPQPRTPAHASQPTFMAPPAIPTGIQPEGAVDLGDEGGVVGGMPGGMPGGVVGGVIVEEPPPPPPPPPRKPARVGGEIKVPALVKRVEPVYPLIAVRAKVTGIVILEATVNEAGEVTDVAVLRSNPLLENASIAAVKQWRYEPLLLNGVPSPFILTVTLTFSLR